jgi:hypothetical protein
MTAGSAVQPVLERRRERRVAVHLGMTLHGADPDGVTFEEVTRTENVCRGGLAFSVRHAVSPGMSLEISIPVPARSADSSADFASQGRVVHVELGSGLRERIVGVEFLGPRFNRMDSPESAS